MIYLDKKGFLFTVTIFLILAYILLSISVWVKAIETSERSFADFYKQSSVELAISQVSPEKVSNITFEIMTRNLFRLDQYSITNPVRPGGPGEDPNVHIKNIMFQLLENGSTNTADFSTPVALTQENSSLNAWVTNLNSSLNSTGVYVSAFKVSNFAINQSDIDLVNYSVDIYIELNDISKTASVSRSYHLTGELPISGLVDPALARASTASKQPPIYRQFFFDKTIYHSNSDFFANAVKPIGSSTEGQGWFYGYLVSAVATADSSYPSVFDIPQSQYNQFILVGTYDEITHLPDYSAFGGIIVTTPPSKGAVVCGVQLASDHSFNNFNINQKNCKATPILDKNWLYQPYVVSKDFNPLLSAGYCPSPPGSIPSKYRCALIVSKNAPNPDVLADPTKKFFTADLATGIFNIEYIRDFVMCGYYTRNPFEPTYLQRLMSDPYSVNNGGDYGIGTFVIGEYSNKVSTQQSRLDSELYTNNNLPVEKIRGLPGCRDAITCGDSPSTGIFTVSTTAMGQFGLGTLKCSNNARCSVQ